MHHKAGAHKVAIFTIFKLFISYLNQIVYI